jgi:hypothetical protein
MNGRFMSFLATAVVALPVAITATSAYANADTEVPWAQRPVSVGSGYRLAQGNSFVIQPVVSASGRWVAFATNSSLTDDDPDGSQTNDPVTAGDVYLRDRWTDTTTRIAHGATASLTMSANGNLIGGVFGPVGNTAPQTWVYRRDTGALTTIETPGAPRPQFLGLNNDGYFLLTGFGTTDQSGFVTDPTTRAGRVMSDGSVSALTYSANGSQRVLATNRSLRYSATVAPKSLPDGTSTLVISRVDATTGATITAPAGLTAFERAPDAGSRVEMYSSALSPNGRYLAVTLELVEVRIAEQKIMRFHVSRLWDTTTGEWYASRSQCFPQGPCPEDASTGDSDFGVQAVLDDGRVLLRHDLFFHLGIRDFRTPGNRGVALSTTYAGDPDPGTPDTFVGQSPIVATDINRVLYCTNGALSPFDTNNTRDCYLKPFPAAPPAT